MNVPAHVLQDSANECFYQDALQGRAPGSVYWRPARQCLAVLDGEYRRRKMGNSDLAGSRLEGREGKSRYFRAARVFLASSFPEKSAGALVAALSALRAFA
jgi:hypothetical protein